MISRLLSAYVTCRKPLQFLTVLLLLCLLYVAIFDRQLLSDRYPLEWNLPASNYDEPAGQEFINTFISKYPSITEAEVSLFFRYKEEVYRERRMRIEAYCNEERVENEDFSMRYKNTSLIYDEQDGVAYCQIAKIASSTWCGHFITLANPPEKQRLRFRNALQNFAPKLWPIGEPDNIVKAWEKTTSIVISRHPLSRLASVYYQKFVALADNAGWGKMNSFIIRNFRKDKSLTSTIPTPDEVIRYIVQNLKSGSRLDVHWKQQHASCPFCLLNFTIYARQEDLQEDTLYFILKAGLEDRLDYQSRLNSLRSDKKEVDFWSAVDINVIAKLAEPWAYRLDFLMLGYSLRDYLDKLNIPYDENVITL